jgi:adenylate cyclase
MLKVRLLGQFKVQQDNEIIDITSRPAQGLFAYLLLNPTIKIRREKLAGMLWPDSDESNARTYLRQMLWRLRKLIGEEYILSDKITVGFNAQLDYDLDAKTLSDCAKEGSLDELIGAVRVYQGDLLPGFYEDWVLRERERLKHIYTDRIGRLLDKLIADQCWEHILDWGEHWIAKGQTPEPAYRALMVAHTHLGDVAAMAGAYRRCADALMDDLGVDPSPETQQYYEQLTQGNVNDAVPINTEREALNPVSDSGPVARPAFLEAPLAGSLQPAFIGRQKLLKKLNQSLGRMSTGQGQISFVSGDSGQGKTALVNEFSHQAEQSDPDLLVVQGRCAAYSGLGDSYLPFRDVLRLLTGDEEALRSLGNISSIQANKLWEQAPLSNQIVHKFGPGLVNTLITGDSPVNPILAEDQSSGYIFEQFTLVLQKLSASHPLLIVLEDLHWADRASISLIFHLSKRIQGHRIMLLGTYRPIEVALERQGQRHPLDNLLNEFKRLFGDFILDLNQISAAEKSHFLDDLLDLEPNDLSAAFRQTLFRKTKGHPLFSIELLKDMQLRGDLVPDGNQRWVESPSLDWKILPSRIEGIIAEKISRLEKGLYEIAQVASVMGNPFPAQVIAAVLEKDEWELEKQISGELARQHRLVQNLGDMPFGDGYLSSFEFAHDLFREFLYNQMSAGERRLLHGKIASVLESYQQTHLEPGSNVRGGDHLPRFTAISSLAYHYDQAGNQPKTIQYRILAGEEARGQYAHQNALKHFERALELIPQDDHTQRYRVIESIETLYAVLGFRPKQKEALEKLKLLAAELDKPEFQAETALREARYFELEGDFQASAQTAKLAVGFSQDSGTEAGGYLQWGRALMRKSNYQDARKILEQALTLAHKSGQSQIEARCLRNLGILLTNLGTLEAARTRLSQAIPKYQENHDLIGEAHVLHNLANTHLLDGNFETASQHFQQALDIREKIGDLQGHGDTLSSLGMLHYIKGDYFRSQSHLEDALEIVRQIDYRREEALVLGTLGFIYLRQGKYDLAKDHLHPARQIFHSLGHRQGEQIMLMGLGLLNFHLGQFNQARKNLERASKVYRENSYRWGEMDVFSAQSMVERAQGNLAAATKSAQQSIKAVRKIDDIYALAYALTAQGHALLEQGSLDLAENSFQEALDLRNRAGQTHLTIEPLAGLAEIQLKVGQPEKALEHVEQLLKFLAQDRCHGPDEFGRVYLICYQVLSVFDQTRANEVLNKGHRLIQRRARKIRQASERQSFLENIPAHRQISKEHSNLDGQISIHPDRSHAQGRH